MYNVYVYLAIGEFWRYNVCTVLLSEMSYEIS